MVTLVFVSNVNGQLFPFGALDNKKLMHHTLNSSNMKFGNKIEFNNLALKPPLSLSSLFNQFNNIAQTHDHKDPENVVRCKYYDLEEVQSMKIPNKNSCLFLFYINNCSLNKNFKDLEYLIKSTNINFNIIAISETRILKDINIVKNINIPNFSFEFTPTESTAGGTLLYVADHLAYQNQNDLNLYKTNNLESTIIEITNPNMSNIIVECIYRHPKMDSREFIHFDLNPLLRKLAKEQKTVFLLGDCNVDLLKYEQHKAKNEFLDSLSSNMFLPHIV